MSMNASVFHYIVAVVVFKGPADLHRKHEVAYTNDDDDDADDVGNDDDAGGEGVFGDGDDDDQ